MKIKTTEIIKKIHPSVLNYMIRVKNQRKLSEELTRRVWWKFEVLEYCDNQKEFNCSASKIKGYFDWRDPRCLRFPSKRNVPKNLSARRRDKPLFHIIRLKENRFKIVWIRNKH
jgi:hypothetical protein